MAARGGGLRHGPIFVVAAPPDARLVASLGGAVEPLVHSPEAIQPARKSGIGVVNDAVLEDERAQARPLAHVGGRIGAGRGRELGDRSGAVSRPWRLVPVVVFDGSLALLLLGERDVEVEV